MYKKGQVFMSREAEIWAWEISPIFCDADLGLQIDVCDASMYRGYRDFPKR